MGGVSRKCKQNVKIRFEALPKEKLSLGFLADF